MDALWTPGRACGMRVVRRGARDPLPMNAAAPSNAEPLHFACPRCGSDVSARLYGPCEDCRAVLRAELRGTARVVEAEAYEPKMHVTPNAVASKDS